MTVPLNDPSKPVVFRSREGLLLDIPLCASDDPSAIAGPSLRWNDTCAGPTVPASEDFLRARTP